MVREDLLTVIEASFLKGRCLAWLSIDAKTPQARAALVAFANQVASGVPFADNGFEAAAGERYLRSVEKWHLNLDLVNGWRCAALPVQATDAQIRRGRLRLRISGEDCAT